MNLVLFILSVGAIGFGIYWYFIHLPDYKGYATKNGQELRKYIKPQRLLEQVKNPSDDIWIIDVREEEYYALGHIPTAKNFPYNTIEDTCTSIPKNKSLILYCDLTLKTQQVIGFLEEKGYTSMLNWGKYSRWKYAEETEEILF